MLTVLGLDIGYSAALGAASSCTTTMTQTTITGTTTTTTAAITTSTTHQERWPNEKPASASAPLPANSRSPIVERGKVPSPPPTYNGNECDWKARCTCGHESRSSVHRVRISPRPPPVDLLVCRRNKPLDDYRCRRHSIPAARLGARSCSITHRTPQAQGFSTSVVLPPSPLLAGPPEPAATATAHFLPPFRATLLHHAALSRAPSSAIVARASPADRTFGSGNIASFS
ncbi:hypothetical protein S40293_10997 [Stachybotrys chartarum IBT 40293]|nr:hypothetical protein S40293_10997 [Stachybotrys chartarum IBT 40293]